MNSNPANTETVNEDAVQNENLNTEGSETNSNEETTTDTTAAEEKVASEPETGNEKYLRLYSEFENFRRRTAKEKIELIQSAGKDVILAILPVVDDMERAIKALKSGNAELSNEVQGFELILKKLQQTLAGKGLTPIECINAPFDVEFHEAVTSIPAPSEEQKGKILDEIEKGYLLNGAVLRYSKVVIGE